MQISQKLYGREQEIYTLLQTFERISQGSVEMMLVTGYSGVGKSALVHEVYKPMTAKQGYFAMGKFDQFQKNMPYSAITQAFNEFCRYLLMENAKTLTYWQNRILTAIGQNGQIIIEVVPDLEFIIGPQPTVAKVGPSEAQNRFQILFLNFIKSLCDKAHPFILFIDDLQWVDSASLGLLKSIMLNDEIQYLFIIGAYRDNEVDKSHPLMIVLDELQTAEAIVNTIELTHLQPVDVSQLLQESLQCPAARIDSLTDLVHQKTQGNAFFTHQFLHMLFEEGLLSFDFDRCQWQWDVEQIAAQNMTDNVVELMANKIDKLPPHTSKALQLAACIGHSFRLSILAAIKEQNQKDILSLLNPAIAEGLIQPLDQHYKHPDTADRSQFKFLHDRVQLAAYALINEEQKQAVHLQIGRLLLKHTPTADLTDKVFDIIEQFNQSLDLLDNLTERLEIARLNLIAGQKAKRATAYASALNYLTIGQQCLAENSWDSDYDLTLNLLTEATETAYLSGDFNQMKSLAPIVLQQARTLADEVKICEIQIQAYIGQNQRQKAIQIALNFLNRLGIHHLTENPTQETIELAFQSTQSLLQSQPIQSLLNLPLMTDVHKKLAMRIMASTANLK